MEIFKEVIGAVYPVGAMKDAAGVIEARLDQAIHAVTKCEWVATEQGGLEGRGACHHSQSIGQYRTGVRK